MSLESNLAFYLSLSDPRYAFLVEGEWGTGKTYQICAALKKLSEGYHYVSIFGTTSVADIHNEILAAANPVGAKATKVAQNVADVRIPGLGLAIGQLPGQILSTYLKNNIEFDRPLFIDDFERCPLAKFEKLGVIDHYLRKGAKIIVATTPAERQNFGGELEKTFGRTVKIKPNISEFISSEISGAHEGHAKTFLEARSERLAHIAYDANINSLRIIRYSMDTTKRLLESVPARFYECTEAIDELIELIFSLALECFAGRLEASEIPNRATLIGYLLKFDTDKKDTDKSDFQKIADRHPTVKLTSDILTDDVLHAVLFESSFVSSDIARAMNASSSYASQDSYQPWKIIWNFISFSDADIRAAKEKIDRKWDTGSFDGPSTFLHEVGVLLFLASVEEDEHSLATVIGAAKARIDRAVAESALNIGDYQSSYRYDGFSGEGFAFLRTERTAEKFAAVADYLKESYISSIGGIAHNRLEELLKRPEASNLIQEEFAWQDGNPGIFSDIPFLHTTDAGQFAQFWIADATSGGKGLGLTLSARYDGSGLAIEYEWARKVIELVDASAAASSGLSRIRIFASVPRELRQRLLLQGNN